MSTSTTNGRLPRKQLADQLDRLDAILDCLAGGLNEAVADAAREGTRLAVKDAIVEVLTNPDLRELVRKAQAETDVKKPAKPSLWARLKAKVAEAKAALVRAAVPVVAGAVTRVQAARSTLTTAIRVVRQARQAWRVVAVGLAVGAVAAAACYVAPPAVAAVVGGAT